MTTSLSVFDPTILLFLTISKILEHARSDYATNLQQPARDGFIVNIKKIFQLFAAALPHREFAND